jgi:replicative DNA helicase
MTTSSERLFNECMDVVEKGRLGNNTGFSTGIPSLDEATGGIQRKTLTTIFGAEGAGKSVLAKHGLILFPIIEHYIMKATYADYKTDLKIRFYSLEVDRVNIIMSMISWLIYKEHGKLYSLKYLFSNRLYVIDDDVHELVKSYREKIVNILDEVLVIIDKPMTADEIDEDIETFAESRGSKTNIVLDTGELLNKYTPHNEDEHIVIIIDTVTNIEVEKSVYANSLKVQCEEISNKAKHVYRNLYHYSIFLITHSNRDITNVMRTKSGEIYPHKNDISISSQLARDSDIVMCIFAPYEYMNPNNDLANFEGYNISLLGQRYRNIGVLKGRNGINMIRVSTIFYGECGYFEEAPKNPTKNDYETILSKKMTRNEYDTHALKYEVTSQYKKLRSND